MKDPVPSELFSLREPFMQERRDLAHRLDAEFNEILLRRRQDLIRNGTKALNRGGASPKLEHILRHSLWPEIRSRTLKSLPIVMPHTPPFVPKPDGHDHGFQEKIPAGPPEIWGGDPPSSFASYFVTSQNDGTIEAGLGIGTRCSFLLDPPHEFVTYTFDGETVTGNSCSRLGWLFDIFAFDPIDKPRLATIDACVEIPEPVFCFEFARFAKVSGELSLVVKGVEGTLINTDNASHVFFIAGTSQRLGTFTSNQPQAVLTSVSVLGPGTRMVGVAVEVHLSALLQAQSAEVTYEWGLAAIDICKVHQGTWYTWSPIIPFQPHPQPGPIRVDKIECRLQTIELG